MLSDEMSTTRKALNVNLNDAIYGTFAEIGAGQETARHFFKAGRASHTVAKSMSAYDMVFSDTIYGKEKSGRYVCKERLSKMLDHEYDLLIERLGKIRGDNTTFFAFANTVSGKTENNVSNCHAWMGVRFQMTPHGGANDIILHVRMLDTRRLDQHEALGVIGVNLLHCAFNYTQQPEHIIPALIENLGRERVEVDMISFQGPDLRHINSRLMSLELIRHKLTHTVMFSAEGKVLQPSDELFRKPVLVQRGTFRPVTKANLLIQAESLKQFLNQPGVKESSPVVMMEITLQSLEQNGAIDRNDFLERVDTLSAVGHRMLVSDCHRYFELKKTLRRYTNGPIGMVIGSTELERIFSESYYTDLEGGILDAVSQLFDDKTRLYVYPLRNGNSLLNTETFAPPAHLKKLVDFLKENKHFIDVTESSDSDARILSQNVRELLAKGDPAWENMVPEKVRDMIRKNGFFGQVRHANKTSA